MHISTPIHKNAYPFRAFTLVEMMVAVTASTILVIAFVGVTISMASTFKAVSNYNDLDNRSRNTLDIMSRDIRNAQQLIGCVADNTGTNYTSLTFTNPALFGNSGFSYTYDGTNVLTRTFCYSDGTSATTIMLTNCDYLAFTLYDKVPNTGETFAFLSVGSATNLTKLVSVSWRCSRRLANNLNTESIQTAQIATRN